MRSVVKGLPSAILHFAFCILHFIAAHLQTFAVKPHLPKPEPVGKDVRKEMSRAFDAKLNRRVLKHRRRIPRAARVKRFLRQRDGRQAAPRLLRPYGYFIMALRQFYNPRMAFNVRAAAVSRKSKAYGQKENAVLRRGAKRKGVDSLVCPTKLILNIVLYSSRLINIILPIKS